MKLVAHGGGVLVCAGCGLEKHVLWLESGRCEACEGRWAAVPLPYREARQQAKLAVSLHRRSV